jgi:uncharacterized RDD family membrane protein YckC
MKNIEIKTTQNVALEYELAGLRERVLAFLIDLVILATCTGLLFSMGAALFSSSETISGLFSIFVICIFLFYTLVMESRNNGQSIGKMAMRIRVIKTAGGQAVFSDYAARWAFRMIDIYFSMGGIASILIASSSRAQRIGDIVANTAVVKLDPSNNLKLKDLLTIHSLESYTPQYLQAKRLMEEDVLVIKRVLDRYRKFPNAAHHDTLTQLAERIRELLATDYAPGDERKFLQTVLQDYVVLTR